MSKLKWKFRDQNVNINLKINIEIDVKKKKDILWIKLEIFAINVMGKYVVMFFLRQLFFHDRSSVVPRRADALRKTTAHINWSHISFILCF